MTFLRGLKRNVGVCLGSMIARLFCARPWRPSAYPVIVFLALLAALALHATAQSFRVLHTFGDAPHRPDGDYPGSALISDGAGNLYGATAWGGSLGSGTIFKLNTSGIETVIYSF